MQAVAGAGRLVAGRYRLSGPIGRGAMGIVWRGRDELLDRDVAVKEVQITSLATPADAEIIYQRTLREARTAARLSHPNVVTVFDVVEESGSPWIVMELVQARSLDLLIAEDGPLPPLEAAQVGESLLSALATAHGAGVLHRDVKPSNVLITRAGRAVLTDFGIATFEGDPGLTQVGMVVGTPGFTAPERLRGKLASPASDLWSLGATLYAAVEGRGPFDRPGGSMMIMDGVVNEDAPRAPSAGPLAPVIEALLRTDPAARPDSETAADLMADAASQAKAGRGRLAVPWPDLAPGHAHFAVASDATTDSRPVVGDADAAAKGIPAASTARRGTARRGSAAGGRAAGGRAAGMIARDTAASGTAAGDTAAGDTAAFDSAAGGAAAFDSAAGGAAGFSTAAAGSTAASAAGFSTAAGSTAAGSTAAGSTAAFGAPPAGDAAAARDASSAVAQDAVAQDAAIPAFMEPPAFADLKMPDLDASADLAGQADLPLPADLPVFMDARRRTGPPAAPPDHAVPWGLAGTSANWAPPDPVSPPGSSSQATTRPAGSPAMRPGTRRRVLAAAMAAVVLAVAGAVGWSAYTRSRTVTASQPQPPAQSPAAPALPVHQARRASSAPHHAGQKTTGPGAGTGATITSKTHPAAGGTPSPKHSSPAKPHSTPTATPSPVATGSGSPGPGGGTPPPPGYQWFQVSAASLGTTAGFRIAVPDTWRMSRNGLVTYLDPAAGKPYITVDVTPFAYPGPVREAMYQQAQAKAGHLYPVYRLVAIRPAGFRGVPEAIWRFHWQEPGVGQIGVLEVFFTLTTSAGKQSYALTVSAPEARFIAVRAIFHQALQTFAPLP